MARQPGAGRRRAPARARRVQDLNTAALLPAPRASSTLQLKRAWDAWQADILVRIAEAVGAADPGRAARLISEAERIARSSTSEDAKASILARIVRVVAAADPDRAERIARSITSELPKAVAVARIVRVVAAADPDRAERIAGSITSEYWKALALSRIVRAAAAAVGPDGASSGQR